MSLQAFIMNYFLKKMNQKNSHDIIDYNMIRENNKKIIHNFSKKIIFKKIIHNGLTIEEATKTDNDKLLFYIHGGGFTTGSAAERREIVEFLVTKFGYHCFSIDYNLSPEHKWPRHLDDVLEAYLYLHERGVDVSKMVVAGESAGATLALSLLLKLKELNLCMPKAVLAFSPCTNQADGFPSHREKAKTDYMLGDTVNSKLQKQAIFGDNWNDLTYLRSPLISPFYGDYDSLPPIFLSASDNEVLYDDSVELYQKLKQRKHKVEIDIQHNVFHAYPMFPKIPEARKTLKKAFDFVQGK
ncbi:alpha/beta hydrolase [Streptococcus moroccensis]|uniref:Acetyl esterase/lipase n=1 Tax=Streptococcus moroccensis TaxID=1451356 RepID=A0ABT9YQH5_9STRE|nr:alpha/beta hydrolase [Streptococcus moroccensis]MDQ0221842.1 acetyl esterase/lipase [Streptococcus moroccensis]